MPPEELQKQIARIKEQEHADAVKMHDIMLSHQRAENMINKSKEAEQRSLDKKRIITLIAISVLLIFGFIYAQKQGFWLNKSLREKDKVIEQAMKRMEEVQKSYPPVTPTDVAAAKNFMSDFRAQEKSTQATVTKKK